VEVVLHGSDVRLVERWPRGLRAALIERLLADGARFRFVSRELLERLVAATVPELRARSRVEPSPLDVSNAPPRRAARAALGVDPEERIAVIATRFVPSKHPAHAIRLAHAAKMDRVVVIGDGPLLESVQREQPRALFLGRLSRGRTLAWISAADVVVSASRDEGAPSVVREARALGTPVLAVPSGDLRDWAREDPGITLVETFAHLQR
jgi:glycosyltransferase involved in cell wall biosynthesis